jgi:hypothetical protein
MLSHAISQKFTNVSEVLTASIIRAIALMMEMSVNFCVTALRNIPDDSHIHIRRRENLKSHQIK